MLRNHLTLKILTRVPTKQHEVQNFSIFIFVLFLLVSWPVSFLKHCENVMQLSILLAMNKMR